MAQQAQKLKTNKTAVALATGVAIAAAAVLSSGKKKIDCKARFLFVGDSTTAYSKSYADQLTTFCPSLQYKKIAKVGEKTGWMLGRLKEELASGRKYDVITILGGINNLYAQLSAKKAKEDLRSMYDLAKQSGAVVVAITPPPGGRYEYYSFQKHQPLHNELNAFVLGSKADHVIDWHAMLEDTPGSGKPRVDLVGGDKFHPNNAGHNMLSVAFWKQLNS